jgi:hypothetical protein
MIGGRRRGGRSGARHTPYDGTVTRGATWAGRLARGLALAAVTLTALGFGTAAPARAEDPIKLSLTMTSLTTSGTKSDDRVTVKFTLTNSGTVPAYGVVAHLWRSRDPIRDQASLTAVAGGSSTWGGWPTGTGSYLLITNSTTAFEPGATRSFKLSATLAQLGFDSRGAAYAFGADVVATADQSSNNAVVAKVRTFVPLPGKAAVPLTSTVLLSSAPTKLAENVFSNDQLTAELTGRLGALLNAAQAGRSWLIDPALYDEVRDQADGYQVFDGTQTTAGTGQQVAADWLARFTKLSHDRGARTLFANPDTDGAQITGRSDVLDWSKTVSATAEAIDDLPLVVVPTGTVVNTSNLAFLKQTGASAVLATNSRTAGALQQADSGLRILAVPASHTSEASSDPTVAITARQFALAQTAICGKAGQVRLLTSAEDLTADDASRPDWVTDRGLGAVLDSSPTRKAELATAKVERLSDQQFSELNRLAADFTAYAELVPESAFTDQREAAYLRSVAAVWITNASGRQAYSDGLVRLIGRPAVSERVQLSVSPRFVMSARSNQFPVTVTNDSLEPIQVRVEVTTDNPQRLAVPPTEVITVGPGQSQTVNIHPEASANGLITAAAHITTASGRRVSADVPLTFEVTELGIVAWIIVGVSGVVLVGATAWRIRQVRRRDSQTTQPQTAGES